MNNSSEQSPLFAIPGGNPYNNEIFCTGLRNPFRWSFDRLTGDIWIGDVGQDTWEEISYLPASSESANFGWRCYEGNADFNNSVCDASSSSDVMPAFEYPTADPAASVIGGVVYRGSSTGLQGYYMAADYFTGVLYKIRPAIAPATGWDVSQQPLAAGIADFGETENGEAYAVSLDNGTVYQLTAANILPVTLVDFQGNPIQPCS
ncbi:MAG: PQQ-dependent sugar dehydrogenase [Bacteroidota bacterium]